MNNCKKLGKYLQKFRGYNIYVGLDFQGRMAATPIQYIRVDKTHRAVILVAPMPPPPQQKKPLVQRVPASALPSLKPESRKSNLEIARK